MTRRGLRLTTNPLLALGLLMLMCLLSTLDRTILSLMIGPIQRDMGLSDTQFGMLQGFAFAACYAVASFPLGWLSDSVRRTWLLGACMFLWSTMTVASGFAPNYLMLAIARMGVGLGEAGLNPVSYSMIGDLFSKERLGRAFGFFSYGVMFGMGAAFLIGGTLISFLERNPHVRLPIFGELRSWQAAFLIAGAPGLVLALLFPIVVREPARSALALRAEPPENLFHFLKEKKLFLLFHHSAVICLALGTWAFLAWMPALLQRNHDLDHGTTGVLMGIGAGVFGTAGFTVGGLAADRWFVRGRTDAHMLMGQFGLLFCLPFVLVAALATQTTTTAVGIFGTFFFFSFPTAPGIAGLQVVTPPPLRGRIAAIFSAAVNLVGAGLGPLVVGLLTDRGFRDKAAVKAALANVEVVALSIGIFAFICAGRCLVSKGALKETITVPLGTKR
jgi:MFS family permease